MPLVGALHKGTHEGCPYDAQIVSLENGNLRYRRIAQSAALRLGLRHGFAVTDSQSFALRNPKWG